MLGLWLTVFIPQLLFAQAAIQLNPLSSRLAIFIPVSGDKSVDTGIALSIIPLDLFFDFAIFIPFCKRCLNQLPLTNDGLKLFFAVGVPLSITFFNTIGVLYLLLQLTVGEESPNQPIQLPLNQEARLL